jgi:hypothetical protein
METMAMSEGRRRCPVTRPLREEATRSVGTSSNSSDNSRRLSTRPAVVVVR